MLDIPTLISDYLLPHWGFVAYALVAAFLGELCKRRWFTREHALTSEWAHRLRRTLPLHPVLLGGLLGYLPGMPAGPGVVGGTARSLYFALSGVLSTFLYDVVVQWLRDRGLPASPLESSLPAPAPIPQEYRGEP